MNFFPVDHNNCWRSKMALPKKLIIGMAMILGCIPTPTQAKEAWNPLTIKIIIGGRVTLDEALIVIKRNDERLVQWAIAGEGPPRNDGNTVFTKTLHNVTVEYGDKITVDMPVLIARKGGRYGIQHRTAYVEGGDRAYSCVPAKEIEVWHDADQAFVRVWASPWDESRQTSLAHTISKLDALNYNDSLAAYEEIKKLGISPIQLVKGLPPEMGREFLRIQQHSFETTVTSQTHDLEILWEKRKGRRLSAGEKARLEELEKKYLAERDTQAQFLKSLSDNHTLLEAMDNDNVLKPTQKAVQGQVEYLKSMIVR